MCVLSATQVLASAMNKAIDIKVLSVGQLVRYNELLLEHLSDYYNTIDLYDLAFEISSVASEFEISINENYERVIRLCDSTLFDYDLYKRTMPLGIAEQIEAIQLPD